MQVPAPEQTYTIDGMTCEHCRSAVMQEVASLAGVEEVEVDLASGALTLRVSDPVADDAVAAAVIDAGYEVRR